MELQLRLGIWSVENYSTPVRRLVRLLRNVDQQNWHTVKLDHRMVEDQWRPHSIPAQIGKRIGNLRDRLLADGFEVRIFIPNPKGQKPPIGMIGKGHQVFGQTLFPVRKADLPVDLIAFMGHRRQTFFQTKQGTGYPVFASHGRSEEHTSELQSPKD